ncbi:hypothetical protein DL770_009207 [Monosporascus sp. CRB-9-2]|nr:hypothetical protein DL770_009207 [Monosporascus sp. CRB-9-2]
MFGSYEPFLVFFVLSTLADDELPREEDLWVRFPYRNGTGDDAPLRSYPPFGRTYAETALPWNEFYRSTDWIAVSDLTIWCELYGLVNVFCSSLIYDSDGSDSGPSFFISGEDGGVSLSAPVVGIIGAVTALAVFGLLTTSACVFGSVRITGCNCGLGRFKGAEKMASDPGVSAARNGTEDARAGGWELGGPGAPPLAASALSTRKDGGTVFGASIRRDNDDDSITRKSPEKPPENV